MNEPQLTQDKYLPNNLEGKSITTFMRPPLNDPNEHLKHRYLCAGGGGLIVAPSGIGKSVFAVQAMISFALGRNHLGLEPARPLSSLMIQAEDDDGDIGEMKESVVGGLRLNLEEIEQVAQRVHVYTEDAKTSTGFIIQTVEPLLERHRPDMLWINPALAYIGGENSSQKDVGGFLRNLLNPVLHKYQCSCFIIHHTNKPPSGREKPDWQAGDFAYAGAGSAEWANWARAVLIIRSIGSHDVFQLVAGKRGSRLNWLEEDGETKAYTKHIAHSKDGLLYWREVSPEEIEQKKGTRQEHAAIDLLPHVPVDGYVLKNALIQKAGGSGISVRNAKTFLEQLIEDRTLHLWKLKRDVGRPVLAVSRKPQPEQELAA